MDQPTTVIGDKPCPLCYFRPGRSHAPACPEFQRIWRENQARTATDAKLGELARICFAGSWTTALGFTHSERVMIESCLILTLRFAVAGKAVEADAALMEVYALYGVQPRPKRFEADVDRIREILATL